MISTPPCQVLGTVCAGGDLTAAVCFRLAQVYAVGVFWCLQAWHAPKGCSPGRRHCCWCSNPSEIRYALGGRGCARLPAAACGSFLCGIVAVYNETWFFFSAVPPSVQ